MEIFRENLRRLRKQRCMSQDEVSRRSGVTVRLVWSYENKKMNPTLDTIERLAKALDVPIAELFEE